MRRREFVAAIAGAFAAPLACAQQPGKRYRLGFLGGGSPSEGVTKLLGTFHQGMRERGWADGTNYVFAAKWAEGKPERYPELARELAASGADVLLATFTAAIRALMQATQTIPIVMIAPGEPVASGLIASLARPGGNVTGMAFDIDLGTYLKQVEFMRQIVPNLARVAVVVNPASAPPQMKALPAAIASAGLKGSQIDVRAAEEIEAAFQRMQKEGVQATIVVLDPFLLLNLSKVVELGLKYRIALGSQGHEATQMGFLMCYAPELQENWRRAAHYVDRILRGAKPGDLPVELPSRIKLSINLKTAKALGLAVPQSVLLLADEVIG
jgi:putative ABC transport system substrate-binding protein